MKTRNRFIVVDDDLINNVLCRHALRKAKSDSEILTFNIPQEGFEYSRNEEEMPTILFLDINMPVWSGWDFLENFDKLGIDIKKQIRIYMLSSSVDIKDIQRAQENRNVVSYLVKPLSAKVVEEICNKDKPNF